MRGKSLQRRWMFWVCLGILLVLLYFLEERLRGQWQLSSARKEFTQQVEESSLQECKPPYRLKAWNGPQGLRSSILAMAKWNFETPPYGFPIAMNQVSQGYALSALSIPMTTSMRRHSWSKESDEYILDVFNRMWYRQVVDELERAREVLRHKEDAVPTSEIVSERQYIQTSVQMLNDLALVHRCFLAAALVCLSQGDVESAHGFLLDGMRILEILHHQAGETNVHQVARMTFEQVAVIWEFLEVPGHTEHQLASLQDRLEQLDLMVLAKRFVLWQSRIAQMEFEFRTHVAQWTGIGNGRRYSRVKIRGDDFLPFMELLVWSRSVLVGQMHDQEGFGFWLKELLWRKVYRAQDHAALMRIHSRLIALCDRPGRESWDDGLKSLDPHLRGFFREASLNRRLAVDLADRSVTEVLETQSIDQARQLAITALAIHRHMLRNGQWPELLDQLVPALLSAVPEDYDGKPLRYRTEFSGYVLYSQGNDQQDRGGERENPRSNVATGGRRSHYQMVGGDWIWPEKIARERLFQFR